MLKKKKKRRREKKRTGKIQTVGGTGKKINKRR